MTIPELADYYALKKEIIQLEEMISDLEITTIGSLSYSNISVSKSHSNSSPTENVALRLVKLKEKLNEKKESLLIDAEKAEEFLNTIDDSEIRLIIRKRFMEGKTWSKISEELIMDRTTPYYKLKNYLKRNRKNETKNS